VNHLVRARKVFDIELAALKAVRAHLDGAFSEAVDVIVQVLAKRGKIIIVGIGKSGNVGQKIAATLTSTGSTSIVLNSVDALHGDLGVVNDGDIILARNVNWPDGWFALITGYLEAGEEPTAAVERELKEELNLDAVEIHPIGNYIFERKNEVMLCYHVVAAGELRLGPELCDYRRYKPHELKPWPRATGFAVADWMRARGLEVEFVDFPSYKT